MADEPETFRKFAKITFGGREATVQELSLRQFKELGKIIGDVESLASMVQNMEKLGADEVVKGIVNLMTSAPDIVARIISTASDLNEEQVLDGTVSDILEAVTAIIKVNNFVDVFKKKLDAILPSS